MFISICRHSVKIHGGAPVCSSHLLNYKHRTFFDWWHSQRFSWRHCASFSCSCEYTAPQFIISNFDYTDLYSMCWLFRLTLQRPRRFDDAIRLLSLFVVALLIPAQSIQPQHVPRTASGCRGAGQQSKGATNWQACPALRHRSCVQTGASCRTCPAIKCTRIFSTTI